jgi:hypothetical protein
MLNKENSSFVRTLSCKVVEFDRFETSETLIDLVWRASQAAGYFLTFSLACIQTRLEKVTC